MGPSLVSDGNSRRRTTLNRGICGFNGAVAGQRRKPRRPRAPIDAMVELQWGRRWSATETNAPTGFTHAGTVMLQWGRRWSATETMTGAVEAAWFTPLQWGRRWSATETAMSPCVPPSTGISLQWGRRWSATETLAAAVLGVTGEKASMGPSLVSDGNCRKARWCPPPTRGFNGAVAGQRRKRDDYQYGLTTEEWLQWGRRWSATETTIARSTVNEAAIASMGPSLVSDGNLVVIPVLEHYETSLQWGRRWSATETPPSSRSQPSPGALQWGRRWSATETQHRPEPVPRPHVLQWGRRWSATETSHDRPSSRQTAEASMGPSLVSDGNTAVPSRRAFLRDASMGPSLVSDGNTLAEVEAKRLELLASMGPSLVSDGNLHFDWRAAKSGQEASMGPSLVSDGNLVGELEPRDRPTRFNGAVAGQRRKRDGKRNTRARPPRFNGAVAGQRRKPAIFETHVIRSHLASMGPSLVSDGNCGGSGYVAKELTQLQWGRRWSATETALALAKPVRPDTRFNGAVAGQRRKRCIGPSSDTFPTRFNGAVAGQRRKPHTMATEPPLDVASMGPSLVSDGNVWLLCATWISPAGFNGAVAGQRRKPPLDRVPGPPAPRFNGAVAGQRRKLHHIGPDEIAGMPLQWGRRWSATETHLMSSFPAPAT